jgi:hypothetical protein
MSIRIAASATRYEMFGTIVGFVSPSMPDVYKVEISGGNVITIHDDEITEFFYDK